jgi:hypothetical protein
MYSYNDFERLFIRYQAEAVPAGETLMDFCFRNKVPYNLFEKWYRDTRHKVVPVKVNGQPTGSVPSSPVPAEAEDVPSSHSDKTKEVTTELLYSIDVRISNGMEIRQNRINYKRLCQLVEKLEAIC